MGETPTPSILQGLPLDVQSVIQPASGNDYSGANNGPVTPGTGLPLPPNMAQNNQAAQPAGPGFEQTPYEKAGGTLPHAPGR